MPLEGFLGAHTSNELRAATIDHPAILQTIFLDSTISTLPIALPVGAVLTLNSSNTYELYDEEDSTKIPQAIVDVQLDKGDTKATCLLHGTAKTQVIQVYDNTLKKFIHASQNTLVKLSQNGIFAI